MMEEEANIIGFYFEDGNMKINFYCLDCGRYHENILAGNLFKCECGRKIYTSPYIGLEG